MTCLSKEILILTRIYSRSHKATQLGNSPGFLSMRLQWGKTPQSTKGATRETRIMSSLILPPGIQICNSLSLARAQWFTTDLQNR